MMVDSGSIAPKNVIKLYSLTGVTPLAGIQDYTDGIYHDDDSLDHDTAQRNQHNYLLDEIEAGEGFRLLDIGCGLGTLLETARDRGVEGVGITISEHQLRKCQASGLNVRLLNYKNIPEEWHGRFDGIIANGSLEHFCQPEDALAGRQNAIYTEMFGIFSRLLNPASSQKVATTAIHFNGLAIDPVKCLRSPLLQVFDPEGVHAAVLYRGYGGYYPVHGQLEECAAGNFKLVKEIDGTEDYRITSEYWCREYNKALFTNPRFILSLGGHFLKRPLHTFWTTVSYFGLQSWPWQFRGDDPPTRLYRHTWHKINA